MLSLASFVRGLTPSFPISRLFSSSCLIPHTKPLVQDTLKPKREREPPNKIKRGDAIRFLVYSINRFVQRDIILAGEKREGRGESREQSRGKFDLLRAKALSIGLAFAHSTSRTSMCAKTMEEKKEAEEIGRMFVPAHVYAKHTHSSSPSSQAR